MADADHTYGANGAVTSVDARNVESGNKVELDVNPLFFVGIAIAILLGWALRTCRTDAAPFST